MKLLNKIILTIVFIAAYIGISYVAQLSVLPMHMRNTFFATQMFLISGVLIWIVGYALWRLFNFHQYESFVLLLIGLMLAIMVVPLYLRTGYARLQAALHGNNQTAQANNVQAPVTSTSSLVEVHDKKKFDDIVASSATKPVVIKVFAGWCPPCQRLKPVYHEVASIMADTITFAEIDIDAFKDREAIASVESLPTVLLFKDGKEVHRFTGFKTVEELRQELKKLD